MLAALLVTWLRWSSCCTWKLCGSASRDLPRCNSSRKKLEDRIGAKSERGALTFSLVKHTSLLLLGLLICAIQTGDSAPRWRACWKLRWCRLIAMLLCDLRHPQMLYRNTDGDWLLPLAPFLRLLALIVRPLTSLLSFFQSLVELARADEDKPEEVHPAEQIEA